MNNCILVMGESGTGKSHSIKELDPKETYIINVLDKALPFRGFRKKYFPSSTGKPGNYNACDNSQRICTGIQGIDKNRPEIKTIVIDDFQYIMANEFMRKANEKGYQKFVDIGVHAWEVIRTAMSCRPDLTVFILSHTETDALGKSKCKTIGRMLDEKITLEGMFTVVLHSLVVDGRYKFLTKNDGFHIAKSPVEMFDNQLIDNNLKEIKEKIYHYLEEDIEMLPDTNILNLQGEAA